LHVYLLEWKPGSRHTGNYGLDECARAISDCVTKISGLVRAATPFLIGHSLGGTVAAVFAALARRSIRGLILLSAPLCFEPGETEFRDAVVRLVPSGLSEADPFPGSLLSYVSALASPSTFIWSRLLDAALSVTDQQAIDLHARVERWALDEVSLPGKLVHQIFEWLYRENRLCRGALKIAETLVGPSSVSVPTLALVNSADEVAPPAAVKPFIDAVPGDAGLIKYPGETGVCLQHLGLLVGREAHARVWPRIISWIEAHW
jgi:polyhydroxyalkanoate synthase